MKKNVKKRLLALMAIGCSVITACGSSGGSAESTSLEEATIRPCVENMSQEDFMQVTGDMSDFALSLVDIYTTMSDLVALHCSDIEPTDDFDWSQYDDFQELKEQANTICNEILVYDDSNCTYEMQLSVDECKFIAFWTMVYFNTISCEWNAEDLLTYTYKYTNEVNVGMDYATVALYLGTIQYMEANNYDSDQIESWKEAACEYYYYEILTGNDSTSSSQSTETIVFSNEYGTSTTKCAHVDCTNPIASTGDTNCCTIHSNVCGNCGKYIDEDAMFCMDCLQGNVTSSERTAKYNSSDSTSGTCQYKYFDGSTCGKSTNHYANLCDKHFEELNDTYNSLTGK